jgi:hypothetical protein
LQQAGHAIKMEEHVTKESPATNKSQQKSRKTQEKLGRWEWQKMSICYLAHGLAKLKPKIENPGGNAWRRLRLDLGCNAIAAAAEDREMVKNQVGSTNILYPSVRSAPVPLHYVGEDMYYTCSIVFWLTAHYHIDNILKHLSACKQTCFLVYYIPSTLLCVTF